MGTKTFAENSIRFENADCMKRLAGFPDSFFDLAICDPPYGVQYGRGANSFGDCVNDRVTLQDVAWDKERPTREFFDEIRRVSKNQIIWGGQFFTDYLPVSKCWVVWDKVCGVESKSPFADCELAWTSFTKVSKIFRLRQIGFISDTKDVKRLHPTQKATELYEWLLDNYAEKGMKILDPMCGSASSLVACYRRGFEAWGYEIDSGYYSKAVQRLQDEMAQIRMEL